MMTALAGAPLWVSCVAAADTPSWTTVSLVLTEYRFTPPRLRFRQGQRYRLVLTNGGKELHEFTAFTFLGDVVVANPDVLAVGTREIVLHPRERKELRFIASRRGRYPLTCADHDWAGMVGEIVVE
jgi:uncharacterized cupredoxin-like copper-binding protein